VKVRKLKMTEPFLGDGGLILDGGEGLLDVAGAGSPAGHGVHNAEGSDDFFCDPAGKAEGGWRVEIGGPI